jgi:hypothetical protein
LASKLARFSDKNGELPENVLPEFRLNEQCCHTPDTGHALVPGQNLFRLGVSPPPLERETPAGSLKGIPSISKYFPLCISEHKTH